MSRPSRALTVLVAALVAVAAPRVAASQARSMTGSIVTSVDVLYPPLTGTGVHALDFGMILPGTTSVVVNPNTSAGGEFRITGTKSRKSVDISFALPTALRATSGASMPLSFNGNYAALCEIDDATGLCVAASYTSWNPTVTTTFHDTPYRYQPGRKTYAYNTYSVYLGGALSPAAGQRAGHYSGTVSVLIVIN